jgi:hypothetical protein
MPPFFNYLSSMIAKIQEVCKKIQDELTMNLAIHHELYSLVAKAEYLEELVKKSAESAGLSSDWTPNFNHAVGTDQTISGLRISNKSGEFQSEGKRKAKWANSVKITGSRTSKHESFYDKLEFLSGDHYDCTIACATDKKEWRAGKKIYHFVALPHVNYMDMLWDEETRKTCIEEHPDIFAWIGSESVSGQLYTKFKSNKFLYYHKIDLSDLI